MVSASGRYVISFNGEIYNFAELRRHLPGEKFRGRSDTEVMLAAVEHWGLETALEQFVGMFAFALWDRCHGVLHLARDRIGVKPLYYAWVDGGILFASELGAIAAHHAFEAVVDPTAISLLLRHKCVPAPYSIYTNAMKLQPGHVLTLRQPWETHATLHSFWPADRLLKSRYDSFPGSDTDAKAKLRALLREAVAMQMVADVPVGAFFSGGIDSSVVVAVMQELSERPINTYTVGFESAQYDESAAAEQVARHLQTNHETIVLSERRATDLVATLPQQIDEPFADSSQIPTFVVAELARRHVTVVLSGDGGDELFGGYNRHLWGPRLARFAGKLPRPLAQAARTLVHAAGSEAWDDFFALLARASRGAFSYRTPGQKLYKIAEVVGSRTPAETYLSMATLWKEPADVVLPAAASPSARLTPLMRALRESEGIDVGSWMMYLDLLSYLPDDILTKVDRATMAVGLEARVPLLDHRLVQFAWSLPLHMKIRSGEGKWILRRILEDYVPRPLIERPKAGFGIPLGRWLAGPLRPWAEDLLQETNLSSAGYFNTAKVRAMWQNFLRGNGGLEYHLWPILVFQAWISARKAASTSQRPHGTARRRRVEVA